MDARLLPVAIRTALACSGLAFIWAISVSARDIQVIALSGEPVPGLLGYQFDAFQHRTDINVPSFNQSGEVAFIAQLRDSSTTLPELGVFSANGSSLEFIAKTGDQAPGAQVGFVFEDLGSLSLSENGKVAFSAVINDGGSFFNRRYGIWMEDGSLSPIVQSGVVAPGFTPPRTLGTISNPKINIHGDVAFFGELSPVSFDGLFATTNGELRKVAFPGEPAPGVRGEFNLFSDSFVIDSTGAAIFTTTTGTGSVSYKIWKDSQLLVAPGDAYEAPVSLGVEPRQLTSISRQPLINPSGTYTFLGRSESIPPGPEDPVAALFSGRDGSVREVVRRGQTLPGQSDVAFTELFAQSVNPEGHIAFVSWTSDTVTRPSLWSESGGEIHMVAKWGDPVPGDPGREFRTFSYPQLNAFEQLAFYANVFVGGIEYYNGIWAENRSGQLQMIAAPGMEIEVAPGVTKTIEFVIEPSRFVENTVPLYFNDRGQVLFRAVMEDGTEGIFISNRVAVPEPTTLWLVGSVIGSFIVVRKSAVAVRSTS